MTKQPKPASELIGFIVKTSINPEHTKEFLEHLSYEDLKAISDRLFGEAAVAGRAIKQEKLLNKPYEVHFTGFGKIDREILINHTLLNRTRFDKKLEQVKSVTQGLTFLVCGETASENKIKKAKGQGVKILDKDDYLQGLKTGELP